MVTRRKESQVALLNVERNLTLLNPHAPPQASAVPNFRLKKPHSRVPLTFDVAGRSDAGWDGKKGGNTHGRIISFSRHNLGAYGEERDIRDYGWRVRARGWELQRVNLEREGDRGKRASLVYEERSSCASFSADLTAPCTSVQQQPPSPSLLDAVPEALFRVIQVNIN